jgi:uncharacterized protein (DUF58 family)
MFPARPLILALLLPTAVSVATVFVSGLWIPLLIVDGLILTVAVFDFLVTRSARIELQWEGREILSIGQNNPVLLRLSVQDRVALSVQIRPDLPAEIVCAELVSTDLVSAPVLSLVLSRHRSAELRYHLIPNKRGEYTLGDHTVRYKSRLGLWIRQEVLPTKRTVQVYPDLAMIRTYEMLARQHRQYALVRASRLRGGESEFARLRDYNSDDDYRFIDWKATARRNQLTTREFQLESDQNIFIMLDCGRLMTSDVAGLSQFDLALNSALLMAHVASTGGDRVGLMCFDEDIRAFLPPQGGPKATGRLVRATYNVHPTLTESAFQNALSAFDGRIKQRCLLMIFTQLIDGNAVRELSDHLRLIARRHLPLVVVLEDTDLADMAAAPGPSTGTSRELYDRGASAELLRWKSESLAVLKKTGALVIETPAVELNNRVINRYLSIKAAHAL